MGSRRHQVVMWVLVFVTAIHVSPDSLLLAASYQTVDFSSQANFTWAAPDAPPGEPVATRLPGAPTGAVTLAGIPFNITSNTSDKQAWHAHVAANGGSDQVTLSMTTNAFGVTDVYTLINTWRGSAGTWASLVFTGSSGETYTKYLNTGTDIRDYNNDGWVNDINGTTTVNVFTVIPDNWGVEGRLDMQRIALPVSFASQTLTTIQLVDYGSPNFQRTVLDGVTLEIGDSNVPEPTTLAIWGTLGGFVGLIGTRRRKTA